LDPGSAGHEAPRFDQLFQRERRFNIRLTGTKGNPSLP